MVGVSPGDGIALAVAFAAAVLASWVGLLVRCEGKGRPFASPSTDRWAVAVIAVLAGYATLAAWLLVQRGVTGLYPELAAAGIPLAALCGGKITKSQAADPLMGPGAAATLLSLGVRLLLDRLDTEMALAMISWVHQVGPEGLSTAQVEQQAHLLYEGLLLFMGDNATRRAMLQRNYRDLVSALARAQRPATTAAQRHARHQARQRAEHAFLELRRLAYLWHYPARTP